MKAYNLRDLAGSEPRDPRAAVAEQILELSVPTTDEDVVLIKVPKGQGVQVVAACTNEHRIKLGRHSYSVAHPLAERLAGDLNECPVHVWARRHFSDGPRGMALGSYEAVSDGDGGFDLTRVPE